MLIAVAHTSRQHPVVAVFADTDSRWKWGLATAATLNPERIIHFLKPGPAQPTTRQLIEAGVTSVSVIETPINEFARQLLDHSCDVVILALPGDAIQAVLHTLTTDTFIINTKKRPIVLTGYVGVVYQGLSGGLLARAGADIVIANSTADVRRFRSVYLDHGVNPNAVTQAPLPFLPNTPLATKSDSRTVTFAAQPDVPGSRVERQYVVEQLAAYARAHPDQQVLLKVRALAGEQITHPEPYPYPRLLARLGDNKPANLGLAFGPMTAVLERTNLLITVSSTAAMEAIHSGIPTAIITDFGVDEKLGNFYFAGSGCLRSFATITEGDTPTTDPAWVADHGLGTASQAMLHSRVAELLDQESLPAIRPYFNLRDHPYYLPRLLASHGLRADGSSAANGAKPSVPRKVLRSLSHSLYRVGSTVLAPKLRKWGSR